jgi:COP9 signalosome complex subunit 8
LFGSKEETATFFFSYMALFLITGDLDGARYLWKRIPGAMKESSQEIPGLWEVGKCLHEQNMSKFRQCINKPWSSSSRPYIDEVVGAVEARVLNKVEKAYTVISAAALGGIVGISADDARSGNCTLQ